VVQAERGNSDAFTNGFNHGNARCPPTFPVRPRLLARLCGRWLQRLAHRQFCDGQHGWRQHEPRRLAELANPDRWLWRERDQLWWGQLAAGRHAATWVHADRTRGLHGWEPDFQWRLGRRRIRSRRPQRGRECWRGVKQRLRNNHLGGDSRFQGRPQHVRRTRRRRPGRREGCAWR
jgi:hypothetical protein